ncbi:MAG TPA: class I SAM-dependent methyltransferase [bacterium]|nr:class I SAM-dependent methyltransferase [bacterium]
MSEKRDFFERLAPTWEKKPGPDADKLRRVVRETGIFRGQTVLDAGAGTGVLIPFLLEAVGPEGCIYALDFAVGMVEEIKKKGFPENVIPVLKDIHRTDFPEAFFDFVVANASFPHFTNRTRALEEMRRILKPGGGLVIAHPAGRTWVNQHHRKMAAVAEDVVFPAEVLGGILEKLGFVPYCLVDEPDFYLVAARRGQ